MHSDKELLRLRGTTQRPAALPPPPRGPDDFRPLATIPTELFERWSSAAGGSAGGLISSGGNAAIAANTAGAGTAAAQGGWHKARRSQVSSAGSASHAAAGSLSGCGSAAGSRRSTTSRKALLLDIGSSCGRAGASPPKPRATGSAHGVAEAALPRVQQPRQRSSLDIPRQAAVG